MKTEILSTPSRQRPALWTTILVPVDFSGASIEALRCARGLAQQTGARVVALHVIEAYHTDWRMNTVQNQRQMRATARRRLDELTQEEIAHAVTELREGKPADRILDAARRYGADLVVMGTRGATGLPHVVLGSVAEHVARHAPCPVLIVRDSNAR